jgi:hypothetical protein
VEGKTRVVLGRYFAPLVPFGTNKPLYWTVDDFSLSKWKNVERVTASTRLLHRRRIDDDRSSADFHVEPLISLMVAPYLPFVVAVLVFVVVIVVAPFTPLPHI